MAQKRRENGTGAVTCRALAAWAAVGGGARGAWALKGTWKRRVRGDRITGGGALNQTSSKGTVRLRRSCPMSKTEGVECLCDEVNQQSIVVVVIVSEWRDAARQLMKLPSMEQEI